MGTPSLWEAFHMGGGFMYPIALCGLAFYSLLGLQLRRHREIDFTAILWGLLGTLVLLGPLGSAMGLRAAGFALRMVPPEQQVEAMSLAVAISTHTTIFAWGLAVLSMVPLSIVAYRATRYRARHRRATVE